MLFVSEQACHTDDGESLGPRFQTAQYNWIPQSMD